jgi:hypothetical protein
VQDRFEEADFDFVASVLGANGTREHIFELWSDLEGRRELMDLPEVLRGLLEAPMALGVSAGFYFYVMVRHALMQADLPEHRLADYMAGLMTRRISTAQCGWMENPCGPLNHAAPFLALIDAAKGSMKIRLKLAAGEQFLILTGLYPSSLNWKPAADSGGVEFYEGFAKRSYQDAAGRDSPFSTESKRTFGCVAACVPEIRRALNHLAEEWFFLGE